MADVLLANAYSMSVDPNERRFKKPYPPLGMLYVASFLRENGLDVKVYDGTFQSGRESYRELIKKSRPDWVGIYATNIVHDLALKMGEIAKSYGAKVMAGGPDPTINAGEYLDAGIDVVVLGEGELTALDVVKNWTGESGKEIKGTATRSGSGINIAPRRKSIKDLDSIPLPARDLLDMTSYLSMWKKHHKVSMVSMITSRGCPYGCTWCSKAIFGRSFRQRSVDNVMDEVNLLKQEYGPDRIWFADDILTMRKKWVLDFTEAMRSVEVDFECLARADLLDEDVVNGLKSAGCTRIYLGVESGSQKVLDAMNKSTTVDQVRTASKLMKSKGIEQYWFIMYGYPGEELDDLLKSFGLLQELLPEKYGMTVAYPIPGTAFFEDVKHSLVGRDWTQSGDNVLLFKNTYPQSFYRAAILSSHGLVRLARLGRRFPGKIPEKLNTIGRLSAKAFLKLAGGRRTGRGMRK